MFQPQNLPRPPKWFDHETAEIAVHAMKSDCEELLFDNVMELCAAAVRGSIIAPPGKKLVVADLSNIEGRVLAWMAGEQWKIEAFRDFDRGIGADLYIITAAGIAGKSLDQVTKDERQSLGKVPELALGYAGGEGAFIKMGAVYGVMLPSTQVQEIIKAWRLKNRRIVSFWYDVERAARAAILDPGAISPVRGVEFSCVDNWLRARLPSGRFLCYPNACVEESTDRITYDGVDQYTRKWGRIETYSGKLVENIVQAVARDVLADGLRKAERAGYENVLHIHDEIIAETPDTDAYSAEGLAKWMASGTSWSVGLPLAAAGFETHRYRKD